MEPSYIISIIPLAVVLFAFAALLAVVVIMSRTLRENRGALSSQTVTVTDLRIGYVYIRGGNAAPIMKQQHFATFEDQSGARTEYYVPARAYDVLEQGQTGVLTLCGGAFETFVPNAVTNASK